MNPTRGSRTSSTPTSDSLRPRARRLISGIGDDEVEIDITSAPSTRVASPRPSRPVSPLPNKYPSRTSVRDPPRSHPTGRSSLGRAGSASFTSVWGGSWQGLQGLASSLLGSDTAGSSRTTSAARSRTMDQSPTRPGTATREWGPAGAGNIQIGGGSKEERDAMVRAAKRKDLLRANGHTMIDASGRHKRRTSDDFSVSGSVQPSEEDDRDALVYLHHVRLQDTFMGITIKFNCKQDIIRKANRLWPNDPVQSRKTILLPVDACGVKGRPVPGPETIPEEHDLLGDESLSMHESPKSPSVDFSNGWHIPSNSAPSTQSDAIPPSSTVSTSGDTEPTWKHESWVLLPGENDPTEIARLPRRHLGFFPRARRKSNTFSDMGTPRLTPTASLDLPRIPPSPGSAQREAFAALKPKVTRNRASSHSLYPNNNGTPLFQGPGGIGTLGKNVRTIGPGKDRLNELLSPHLPDVAPPPTQTVFTPWNPGLDIEDDLISFAASDSIRASPDAAGQGNMDLQEMGGKVERWVRKTVKRAGSAYQNSAGAAHGRGVKGMGAGSGAGDLIELTDAFEIGEGDDGGLGMLGGSSSAMPAAEGVRGRRMGRGIVGEEGLGVKGGKSD